LISRLARDQASLRMTESNKEKPAALRTTAKRKPTENLLQLRMT
jgi:hypothetical protein